MASLRVIIIGAGWSGLAAASTYLRINPDIDLTILDGSDSPGGVWSKSRLYEGLLANSPNGLYEYTNFSMIDDQHATYDIVPGEQVQDYLDRYARRQGIYDRIRFGVQVVRATRRGGVGTINSGWALETSAGETFECDKLIVATGLYSKPKLPRIPQATWTGVASIHSKDLGAREKELTSNPTVQSVVVVGGCKSAIEASSIFISAGKKVHWVVRPSPQGVPVVVLKEGAKPNLMAINNTRLFGITGPSIFDTTSFWYRFLHKPTSGLGVWLRKRFWRLMSMVVKAGPKYRSSANGRKIEPEGDDLFYDAPYIGVLYTDRPFLRWMHDESKIEVHRARPVQLVGKEMELDDGTKVAADAVVWCTGWRPGIDFFGGDEARTLGLPVDINVDHSDVVAQEKKWATLAAEADAEVKSIFPQLQAEPRPAQERPTLTQFRMYRQILSPRLFAEGDRSIIFCGLVSSSQTAICSELMALWGIAWLEALMPTKAIPSRAEMERDVARVNAWMARRYGGRGLQEPVVIMEIQSFLDTLVADLGLVVHRKRDRKGAGLTGWLREWIEPYRASDYKGVVDEFLQVVRSTGKGNSR